MRSNNVTNFGNRVVAIQDRLIPRVSIGKILIVELIVNQMVMVNILENTFSDN